MRAQQGVRAHPAGAGQEPRVCLRAAQGPSDAPPAVRTLRRLGEREYRPCPSLVGTSEVPQGPQGESSPWTGASASARVWTLLPSLALCLSWVCPLCWLPDIYSCCSSGSRPWCEPGLWLAGRPALPARPAPRALRGEASPPLGPAGPPPCTTRGGRKPLPSAARAVHYAGGQPSPAARAGLCRGKCIRVYGGTSGKSEPATPTEWGPVPRGPCFSSAWFTPSGL